MKTTTLIGLLAVVLGTGVVRGSLTYTENFNGLNMALPVGNPLGVSFSESVSDLPVGSTVVGVTVDLAISGGYNGNLYAYLVGPNRTLVTLLNRPGTGSSPFGYLGSGLNVTLSDTASGSIQTTAETPGAVFSGTYQAAATLGNINGSAADGTWTLFFADEVSGGGQPILDGFSLGITAVPEQASVALLVFLGLVALHWCLGKFWGAKAAKHDVVGGDIKAHPAQAAGRIVCNNFVTGLGSVTKTGSWVPVWGGWRRFWVCAATYIN